MNKSLFSCSIYTHRLLNLCEIAATIAVTVSAVQGGCEEQKAGRIVGCKSVPLLRGSVSDYERENWSAVSLQLNCHRNDTSAVMTSCITS